MSRLMSFDQDKPQGPPPKQLVAGRKSVFDTLARPTCKYSALTIQCCPNIRSMPAPRPSPLYAMKIPSMSLWHCWSRHIPPYSSYQVKSWRRQKRRHLSR